ncbi:spore germination protein [Desertibacillus haloalkaliphilus]|uniref:spore germination protein n=1 Tax=Desertibacillus haloalkaliphilus TaxID=1328930 RepID=UPI001C27EF73|nr:spore germination protein [Desertibacillus haloalkaliphilus]MBU8905470.1 spore germination protein [Desertibacillus haloalkaliphilus]
MFKKLLKRLNENSVRQSDEYDLELSDKIEETVKSVNNIIGESSDIVQRDFHIGKKVKATLFFIDGLADDNGIEKKIIKPLMSANLEERSMSDRSKMIDHLMKDEITFVEPSVETTFDDAILPLMSGETLLIIDGVKQFFLFDTRQFTQRAIEEPDSEIVVRGPRDGFNEVLHTNVVLLRRRIRDPNLTVQFGQVGRRAKHDFALLYMKGIANQELIDEVRYRMACIDTDDVAETGSLEQYIEDNVLSPFPQMMRTERPDKIADALLNGKVVVVMDGTPFVVMMPVTFHELFKSPEDNYDRWHIGSLLRMLRYIAAFIAMFLPALYIAMVSYHQGMIPTTLALSIAGSREGVPFPGFVEAFLMEFTIELLREAGVRLPRAVGQTIGIVGGLVIGDAAVRAGIVSPIMVIVVALTAIASFAIPAYNVSITLRILRFAMMIAAAMFGLFGIVIVYILINIHFVGLRSFGSYYASPFAPYYFPGWLDTIIRAPHSIQKKRPAEPKTVDNRRSK